MRLLRPSAAAILIVLFGACSRETVLDENRAKVLIQESLQGQPFMFTANMLTPLMSPSTHDYRSATADSGPPALMSRLLTQNLIVQQSSIATLPQIAGTWSAEVKHPSGDMYYTLRLTQDGYNVAGTCEYGYLHNAAGWGPWRSTTTGQVTSGSVTLDPYNGNCFGIGHPVVFSYSAANNKAYLQQQTWGHDIRYVRDSVGQLNVTIYQYVFSPSIRTASDAVEAGTYEIVEVSNLHLEGETRAVANFTWRTSLNKLGQILAADPANTRASQTTGSRGLATFVKKPNGSWVLAEPVRFSSVD